MAGTSFPRAGAPLRLSSCHHSPSQNAADIPGRPTLHHTSKAAGRQAFGQASGQLCAAAGSRGPHSYHSSACSPPRSVLLPAANLPSLVAPPTVNDTVAHVLGLLRHAPTSWTEEQIGICFAPDRGGTVWKLAGLAVPAHRAALALGGAPWQQEGAAGQQEGVTLVSDLVLAVCHLLGTNW